MAQPSLFSRPAELAARFRRESLAARADDRIETADHFERIAALFEELAQRNAAEEPVAATMPDEPAVSDPPVRLTHVPSTSAAPGDVGQRR